MVIIVVVLAAISSVWDETVHPMGVCVTRQKSGLVIPYLNIIDCGGVWVCTALVPPFNPLQAPRRIS